MHLYQFGQTQELNIYTAESEGRLTKCHFDPYGAKFGGSDSRGDMHIWKFDSSPSSIRPAITLNQCHNGAINDFTFLNSSSILATAGMSTANMNVAIWDTLMPPEKARIQGFVIGEAGIASLAFSSRHNLLFAGGKKGTICKNYILMIDVMDIRNDLSLVNSFVAHDNLIKSISINMDTNTLLTGSTQGDLKVINQLTIDLGFEFDQGL